MTSATTTGMAIEMRSLDEITPYPNNPRVNDGAVEAVARSIRSTGSASRSWWMATA
jgi:hypothetical protein